MRDARNLKDLSYATKFEHEVVRCAEERGSCKATATFAVDSNMFDCGRNTGH
jgi:hypothetical protein